MVLSRLGRRPVEVMSRAQGAESSLRLADPSPYQAEAPRRAGRPLQRVSGTFPELRAHVFRDVVASPYSSGVLDDEHLYLPQAVIDARGRVRTDSDGMFHFDQTLAVSNQPECACTLENAIHVGGAGAFNWFHFVMEVLPKVFLANRLPGEYAERPFVLPDECRRHATFAEALEVFSTKREAVYLKRGQYVKCKNLVIIDDVSTAPFNMHPGHWPKITDYTQNDDLIVDFMERLRSALLSVPVEQVEPRRIFLVRPEGVRRDFNQNELAEIASRHGFERVSPETMTLREQARLFSNAEYVIGASGAAWVGIIFRPKTMKGVSWLIPEYSEFSSYSGLAALLRHDVEFIETRVDRPTRSTAEAYQVDYHVPPEEFERALERMTGP
jgi:hypothetical protein